MAALDDGPRARGPRRRGTPVPARACRATGSGAAVGGADRARAAADRPRSPAARSACRARPAAGARAAAALRDGRSAAYAPPAVRAGPAASVWELELRGRPRARRRSAPRSAAGSPARAGCSRDLADPTVRRTTPISSRRCSPSSRGSTSTPLAGGRRPRRPSASAGRSAGSAPPAGSATTPHEAGYFHRELPYDPAVLRGACTRGSRTPARWSRPEPSGRRRRGTGAQRRRRVRRADRLPRGRAAPARGTPSTRTRAGRASTRSRRSSPRTVPPRPSLRSDPELAPTRTSRGPTSSTSWATIVGDRDRPRPDLIDGVG